MTCSLYTCSFSRPGKDTGPPLLYFSSGAFHSPSQTPLLGICSSLQHVSATNSTWCFTHGPVSKHFIFSNMWIRWAWGLCPSHQTTSTGTFWASAALQVLYHIFATTSIKSSSCLKKNRTISQYNHFQYYWKNGETGKTPVYNVIYFYFWCKIWHQLVMVSSCLECKTDGILDIWGLNITNLFRKRE